MLPGRIWADLETVVILYGKTMVFCQIQSPRVLHFRKRSFVCLLWLDERLLGKFVLTRGALRGFHHHKVHHAAAASQLMGTGIPEALRNALTMALSPALSFPHAGEL